MKILKGSTEIELTTTTEVLLAVALKAVLFEKGEPATLKDAFSEIYLNRFSFVDTLNHRLGTIQLAEDGNNGRDMVRLVK